MAALETRSSLKPQGAIDTALAEVAARVRSQCRLRGGIRGLIAALSVDIVLAALSRADILPSSLPLILVLIILPLAGAVLGSLLASRHLTPIDAAQLAEAHLPLKERLSSALEFDRTSHSNPLLALQHADAETHARTLDTRLIAPRRVPRELWLAALLLLLLALTLGLPNLPFALTSAQRGDRQSVRAAGRQLQDAAHAASQQADVRHDAAAKLQAQKIEALGKRMSQGHMDRAQALAAVSQQEQQAAGAANDSPASTDPGQAAKSLAGALSSPTPSSAASKSAKGTAAQPGLSPAKATAGKSPGSEPHRLGQSSPTGQTASAQSKPAAAQSKPAAAQSKPVTTHPPSSPSSGARDTQSSRGKEAAAGTQAGDTSPKSGATNLHQALENAHHQLSGANPSSVPIPNTPPSSTPPSGKASPHSPSRASASKPSVAGKPNNAGQPSHGTPGGTSHSAGKGQNGLPGQGKVGRQTSGTPGSASNQPAPGGDAGATAKIPFHAVLPPTIISKNEGLYLGTPHQKLGTGATLRHQLGQPDASKQPSRVPYGQVLPRYRKSAEAALDQERVPPSQRAVVRNYFNALQPAK